MFLIVSHLWERLDVESLTRKGRGSSTRFGRVASVGAKAGVAPNKSTLIPTERRRHTYFVAGCCFDPVLRGLGKFEASCLFAYLIQFTPREPHPLAGVGAAAIPEFSEFRVRNCRRTLRAKKG